MIWLLLPLAALCMGYVTRYVWRLDTTIRWSWGIGGPGVLDRPIAPEPRVPADQAPPVLGPDDIELLALLDSWRYELAEEREPVLT